jgi:hypothetical protein
VAHHGGIIDDTSVARIADDHAAKTCETACPLVPPRRWTSGEALEVDRLDTVQQACGVPRSTARSARPCRRGDHRAELRLLDLDEVDSFEWCDRPYS